jgi:enoyl-[acyl-carrier protein] reductase II
VKTRITDMLGIEKPIIQAAMGWIARSQLSSAVSNAGGMGIIETSSGELDAVREEIRKMKTLTTKPFGVNVAQAFVRDPNIISFIIDQGIKFVTTSAGDPMKYTGTLKDAGLTVFHVVPSLAGALRAVEAGVDGLIVEGGEGGGFKNPKDVASMVLIPQVCEKVSVPVVAAGGIMDGRTMAAAFALGAEGVLMGTRILSSAESPVHANWKDAIVSADSTDTVFLNRQGPGPALRALRTVRAVGAVCPLRTLRSSSARRANIALRTLCACGTLSAVCARGASITLRPSSTSSTLGAAGTLRTNNTNQRNGPRRKRPRTNHTVNIDSQRRAGACRNHTVHVVGGVVRHPHTITSNIRVR